MAGPMTPVLFTSESPRPAALLRIALGGVLLVDAAIRWPYAVELYSSSGPAMPALPGTWFEPPAPGPAFAILAQTLQVFALACMMFGWRTRLSLALAFGLSAWLGLLDSPGTFKKYSAVSLHLLLLLGFTRCGAVWSVDRWLERRNAAAIPLSPRWPRLLMRMFLASVYLGAAVTKLKLPDFATGDLLMFALLDDLWGGTWLGQWLAVHPRLLPLVSLATILFELTFPVLVWVPPLRRPMLAVAALFHTTLWMTMHLGSFSPVMLAALVAFLEESDLSWIRRRGEQSVVSEDAAMPSPGRTAAVRRFAIYAAAAALVAVAGLEVQKRVDGAGVFTGRGPTELTRLDSADVERMLAEQKPALADSVHRVDVGSRLSGGRVFGPNRSFAPGTTVYAAARLVPGHTSFKTTWLLIAPDGREVSRLSRPVEAAIAYATIGFEMPADAPRGRYRIILQLDGYDAANRWFELELPP